MRKFKQESQSFKEWTTSADPKKILIIRFHAIGDVAITIPTSTSLHNKFPDARIDFLTTYSSSPLPQALTIFHTVHSITDCPTRLQRLNRTIRWGFYLRRMKYDVIVDLQRNWMSRIIRRIAQPKSWGEFDRFTKKYAGDRVLQTFENIGFNLQPVYRPMIHEDLLMRAKRLLIENGWNEKSKLIVLNPAGNWETKNWSIQNYLELALLLRRETDVKFLLLGTDRIKYKSEFLQNQLEESVINLVNRTSLDEAYAIVQFVDLIISDDSGLMHMAWTSGIPTIALFGASPHFWAAPQGSKSFCFHSGDLPCAACMKPVCQFGDVRCLTRITPEIVFEKMQQLQSQIHRHEIVI